VGAGLGPLFIIAGLGSHGASAAAAIEGSQGTDTALPLTDSAVTVKAASVLGANSPFAGLTITVNQTRNLTNQAVSVTWTGGTPTDSDLGTRGRFDDNYLQIFECWGADPHAPANNPGPPPTNCEFGANELNASSLSLSDAATGGPIIRQLLGGDTSPYAFVDPGGATYIPFQPVDGTAPIDVPTVLSTNPSNLGQPVWANPYFDYTTTNEVDYSRTYSDGTGSELFTVNTGLEAPGLGCGEKVSQPSGSTVSPQCWLVVVPRGTPAAENPPNTSNLYVLTSAVSGEAWAHRIAIPLGFNPIGSSCQLGSNERRIVGSELLGPALNNWEPALCASPTSPPYQYSPISDDQARQELLEGTAGGGPGMAVVSRPVDSNLVSATDPVTYAPLALSAVVIGFNLDREVSGSLDDPAEQQLLGQRIQHVYLTPRLVAKLLTESYADQFFQIFASFPASGYDWLKDNPSLLVSDPDFLQFNPEFHLLECVGTAACGGLIVEQPTSDAAYELWRWILADPEARAWLNGAPDPWGMRINPYYSTNPHLNPGGTAFGNPTPEQYPKSDPYSYQDQTQLPGAGFQRPRPLGMQDILPYTLSMQAAAFEVRTANDAAKTSLDLSATSPDTAWTANGPLPIGAQFALAVTDSADAAQYGLQTASLSRAGDDRPNRVFVAPDTAGIEAGQRAMSPTLVSGALEPNVSTTATGAYPLSTLTYAAVTAPSLDKPSCRDYATLIDYAVGQGQVPGVTPGQLPPGYAPLARALVNQSTAAAQQIMTHCAQSPTGTRPPVASPGAGAGVTFANSASTGAGSSGASSSPSGSTGATATTAGRSAPNPGSVASKANAALSANSSITKRDSTSGVAFALTRILLPLLVAVGLIAVLGARWLDVWTRRVRGPGARR
jgi:hypothetical protein